MTSNMLYTMKEVTSALYVISPQVDVVAQKGLNHDKWKKAEHIYSVWIYLHSIDTLYVMYTTHKNILYLTTWPQPCSGKLCVPRSQWSRDWCEITWKYLSFEKYLLLIRRQEWSSWSVVLRLHNLFILSNLSKCLYSTWFSVSLFHSILIWHGLIWLALKRDKRKAE